MPDFPTFRRRFDKYTHVSPGLPSRIVQYSCHLDISTLFLRVIHIDLLVFEGGSRSCKKKKNLRQDYMILGRNCYRTNILGQ
jgi:hypothetical protein